MGALTCTSACLFILAFSSITFSHGLADPEARPLAQEVVSKAALTATWHRRLRQSNPSGPSGAAPPAPPGPADPGATATPGGTGSGTSTPGAAGPGATTPVATTPDPTTPNATDPGATTIPDATGPAATTPGTTVPDATTPDATGPVTPPAVTATDPVVTTPPGNTTTPVDTTPDTTSPGTTVPDATTPDPVTPPAGTTTDPGTTPTDTTTPDNTTDPVTPPTDTSGPSTTTDPATPPPGNSSPGPATDPVTPPAETSGPGATADPGPAPPTTVGGSAPANPAPAPPADSSPPTDTAGPSVYDPATPATPPATPGTPPTTPSPTAKDSATAGATPAAGPGAGAVAGSGSTSATTAAGETLPGTPVVTSDPNAPPPAAADGSSTAAIAGGAAGAVVAVIAACIACFVFKRHKGRRREATAAKTHGALGPDGRPVVHLNSVDVHVNVLDAAAANKVSQGAKQSQSSRPSHGAAPGVAIAAAHGSAPSSGRPVYTNRYGPRDTGSMHASERESALMRSGESSEEGVHSTGDVPGSLPSRSVYARKGGPSKTVANPAYVAPAHSAAAGVSPRGMHTFGNLTGLDMVTGGQTGADNLPAVSGLHMLTVQHGGASGGSTSVTSRGSRSPVMGVHSALDFLLKYRRGVFDSYTIDRAASRQAGGQAVVAFVTGPGGQLLAAKFFATEDSFQREAAVYQVLNQWGGKEHPFVTDVVDNSGTAPLKDSMRIPSYIIMNRGESMQTWIRNRAPPPLMALWMLGEVSGQLAMMHGAGFVHRDVKPGNVLWIPTQNKWRLIDFGSASRVDEWLPPSFTLRFAAPETVRYARDYKDRCAAHAGDGAPQCVTQASKSEDIWAVGVMAFEMITGRSIFPEGARVDTITAMLLEEELLPHEEDDSVWLRLGRLQGLVRNMLHRDPDYRPSADEVAKYLEELTLDTRAF